MDRIGIIGIVVSGDRSICVELQKLLSCYGEMILGRMGIPQKQYGISAISLIVKGTMEQIGELTSKLGRLDHVNVKSALLASDVIKE